MIRQTSKENPRVSSSIVLARSNQRAPATLVSTS